jgi:tetratricopeptide (TPR) repeat protein
MAFEELKMAYAQPSLDIDTKMRILYTNFYQVSTGTDTVAKQGIILSELMVSSDPKEPKTHYMYGDFLYRSGDYKKAREQYLIAVGQDSSKYTWWSRILNIDEQLNDYTSLAGTSKLVIALFPSYTDPYLLNGIANYQLKKYTEAITALRQGVSYVIDDSAKTSAFLSLLGDASNSLKQYPSSDSAYEQALKFNPNNDGVLNNYSYYLSLRDTNLDNAAKMSKRSNELVPNYATYEDTYAWILYKMGKYQDAKDWEDKAIQHGGIKDNALLDHYGDIAYKLGNKDTALEYWQKAKDGGLKSDLLDKKLRDKKLYEK